MVAARKGTIISSYPNMLREEPRPRVSSFDDDGPGEKSAFGPRHDNDHVYIPDISILPTVDECLSTSRLPWVPKRNVLSNHFMEHGYSRHIDTHFRLLRHDSVEKIRDINYKAAQEAFLRNAQVSESYLESSSGHRFFLYPHVRVEAVVPDEYEGLTLQLSYDCPEALRGRQMYKSTRLEKGMMCSVLQLDHDTNELCIYYFNIQHRLSTHALESRNGHERRAAVELSLLPHISDQDRWDIMSIATAIRPNTSMALIEYPRILYAGFGNALHCLQQMSDFSYSFGQYISPRQDEYALYHDQKLHVQPPSYSKRPDFTFDLQPLTGKPESQFSLHDLAKPKLELSLRHLAEHTTLDRGQAIALLSSLNREIAFTQGPPGCGKTFLGVALARVLLASRPADRKLPVLLVCHTNHALDAFMTGLRDAGVDKLMRVGGASKEEWTRAINLRGLAREEQYTRGERGDRRRVDVEKDSNFAHLEAWCKGLSGEFLTGFPCWQHVSSIVEREYPHIHSQLITKASEPRIQALTYNYWAKGGDLSTIESLQNELLKRLHVDLDGKDDTGRALADAKALLTNIAAFTKTQTTAAGANDVWRLPLDQRQALLVEWQAKVDKNRVTSKLCEVQKKHKRLTESVRSILEQKDIRVMQKQNIVGMTTTACAGRREMLQRVGFEIMICEEAGEVLEAHALCCLLPTLKHAINVGDPLQLRPDIEERTLTLETDRGKDYRLDESLFERIMKPRDALARTIPTTSLDVQRRMHPDIAALSRVTYPFLRDHITTFQHPLPKGLHDRMWWLHHEIPEDDVGGVSKSHANMHEVNVVKELVNYLLRGSDYSPGDIAVLTPYAGQVIELRKAFSHECAVWLSEKDKDILVDSGAIEPDSSGLDKQGQLNVAVQSMLRLATIDNFQGEEAKVIILTTVRSGHELGFLKIPNRINVMCSRAKHGFYVVGNAKALEAHFVWKSIIDIFVTVRAISDSIRLQCDRHPEHYIFASSAQDFANFARCQVPCDQELDCGHLCTEPCHDPSLHKVIPCKEPCSRTLQCGHKCHKSCGERCGPCQKTRRRFQRSCGHYVLESCSGDVMPCDHFEGFLTLSCGRHAVGYTCGEKAKSLRCDAICGEELACGHPCLGKCAVCDITQQHAFCQAVCSKHMTCGHQCKATCHHTTECPTCKQVCPSPCPHAAAVRKCDEAAVPCLELVRADGPYGWVQETACCLTLSRSLAGQPQLLQPAQIETIFQPALRLVDKKLDGFLRKVQYRGQVLENTSSLFLYHQVVLNKAQAASKNIELILGRGDEILELQKQTLALRRVLVQFELGIRAVETAYSRQMPAVPDSTWIKFDTIETGATLARARDAKTTASFLLQNQDQSQQMSRAACELGLFAKALLDPLLKEFKPAKAHAAVEGTLAKCRDLLSEVELILSD